MPLAAFSSRPPLMVTLESAMPRVRSSERLISRPLSATDTSSAADMDTDVCERTDTDLASTFRDSSAVSLMFLPLTLIVSPAATLMSALTSTEAFSERTCSSSPKNRSAVCESSFTRAVTAESVSAASNCAFWPTRLRPFAAASCAPLPKDSMMSSDVEMATLSPANTSTDSAAWSEAALVSAS